MGLGVGRLVPFARAAPSATVSVAKCDTYGAELLPTLDRMFDQLGGLGRLVKGRTVAIKLNLTGPPTIRLGRRPAGLAHWVHPGVIGAVVHLMDRAGAQRVRLLESGYASAIPLDEYMYQAGWNVEEIVRRGARGWSSRTPTGSAAGATTTGSTCRAEASSSPPTTSTTPTGTATSSSR